jgi:hypothetical protein
MSSPEIALYNPLMRLKVGPKIYPALATLAALCFTLSLAATGKDRDFTKPVAQPAKTYPFHDDHTSDKVAIAADPYDTRSKSKIFSINFEAHNFLPIFFIITNDGDRPVSIASMQVTLTTASRAKLTPVSSDDIFRRLTNPHETTPIPIPIPQKKVKGGLNQKDRDEIATSQFAAKAVEPHTTQSGFLFFDTSDVPSPLEGAHLYVEGVNDADGKELMYFEIALEK